MKRMRGEVVVPEERLLGPFTGWTEDQQCFGGMWEEEGVKLFTDPPAHASKVCALGRMVQQGIPPEGRTDFDSWLRVHIGADMVELNDRHHVPPSTWEFWWDCFVVMAVARDRTLAAQESRRADQSLHRPPLKHGLE